MTWNGKVFSLITDSELWAVLKHFHTSSHSLWEDGGKARWLQHSLLIQQIPSAHPKSKTKSEESSNPNALMLPLGQLNCWAVPPQRYSQLLLKMSHAASFFSYREWEESDTVPKLDKQLLQLWASFLIKRSNTDMGKDGNKGVECCRQGTKCTSV